MGLRRLAVFAAQMIGLVNRGKRQKFVRRVKGLSGSDVTFLSAPLAWQRSGRLSSNAAYAETAFSDGVCTWRKS
jgi:hypothetical protein